MVACCVRSGCISQNITGNIYVVLHVFNKPQFRKPKDRLDTLYTNKNQNPNPE